MTNIPFRASLCLAAGVVVAMVASANAQQPRYVPPAGNPLPNALNYFRRDVGVLDPYNAFVAPRRQLESQLATMTAREQANFTANQQAIAQVRASTAAPTGVGATFMNYSHFYRLPGARGPIPQSAR